MSSCQDFFRFIFWPNFRSRRTPASLFAVRPAKFVIPLFTMDVLLFVASATAHVYLLHRLGGTSMGNTASQNKGVERLLVEPAMNGDLAKIQSAVAKLPSTDIPIFLSQQDANGNAAIHGAVFAGQVAVVEYLAANGASLELQNSLGCSPTWLAAGYNQARILEFLLHRLNKSSALLTPNTTGDSPLIAAASKGHTDICKQLLEKAEALGVTTELRCGVNHSKDTALSVALGAGIQDDDLILMLCCPSILNQVNDNGVTPLLIACERDLPVAVRSLVTAGADASVQDTAGDSILAVAAFCGNESVVELLLSKPPHGSLLNGASTTTGCTPLWLATRAGHLKCTKLLLEAGADATAANKDGLMPRQAAEKFKRPDMVDLFVAFEEKK